MAHPRHALGMSARAEWLNLLRARSAHELGESYRVTPYALNTKDVLWVGPQMRCQILDGTQAPDASGLLIHTASPTASPTASLATLATILSSKIVRIALEQPPTIQTLAALPLPERSGSFEAQLEALWHHGCSNFSADTSAPEWRPILGSFDRICAELYRLTLDELMTFL